MDASPTVRSSFPSVAFRLVIQSEWEAIQRDGIYEGSAIDLRDGYLHMSPANEVRSTAERYFKDCKDLILLIIDLAALGTHISWDFVPSRLVLVQASLRKYNFDSSLCLCSGAHFPHLYDIKLPLSAVSKALPVGNVDGSFMWPSELSVANE